MGSSKFRQRVAPQTAQMTAKPARAVRAIHVESESSGSDIDSCGSDSDSDRRNGYMAKAMDLAPKPDRHNVCLATAADLAQNTGYPLIRSDQVDRDRHYDRESFKQFVRTVGRRDMMIADVGRDLRVKSVDVRGILRKDATTYVPCARTSTRKEVSDGTVL